MFPAVDAPGEAPGATRLRHEYLFTLNVFNLLLSSTPLRLCPFTPVTTDAIMSNADDFQDRLVRVERLSPSHTARISVFPYTSLLGNCSQDVSPPLVIWITPFPFVTYVQTHYPEMFLPNLFRHLQHGQCLCFTQERAVGTNNTPYSYTPKGRLCLVTPSHHLTVSTLSFYAYGLLHCMTYRHKLHYEDLGSQRWYFQPLRYSIPQGTLNPGRCPGLSYCAPLGLCC